MDPASVTAATAATAAKVAAFPTTLLLLFFVTPPGNGPKSEATNLWSLQSTSQFQTENPEMCTKLAWDMINEMKPVRTLTLRAYCLCPSGNGTNLCFNPEQASSVAASADPTKKPQPTTLRIGPDTYKNR